VGFPFRCSGLHSTSGALPLEVGGARGAERPMRDHAWRSAVIASALGQCETGAVSVADW
jgi:hypothetical protein